MSGFTPYENSEDDNIDNIEDTHLMRNVGEIIFPSSSINPLIAPTSRTRQGGEDDYHEDVHRTQPQYPNPYQSINVIQPSSTQPNQFQFQSYTIRHSHSFSSDKSTTSMSSGQQSPFFRPSTPRPVTVTNIMSTPNGTHVLRQKKERLILRSKKRNVTDQPEKKSTVVGATCNLVNIIVGAGIIGIPYAMNKTGIIAGIILIITVAILADRSLRMLIEAGKHANVTSYEMLMEAIFGGRLGFIFISVNMFIMNFGAMVCYLLIIKETFVNLVMGHEWIVEMVNTVLVNMNGGSDGDFDASGGDYGGNEAIVHVKTIGQCFLIMSTLIVILPLSMQRDMANLSTTSTISVIFDILMVVIVAISSPVNESIEHSGGIVNVMKQSTFHAQTFFIGLGVLSFAFVCQDSSFIIAGSLDKPTKKRWNMVTRSSLTICTLLGIVIGVTGYLGFQGKTKGNVLQNFLNIPKSDMLLFGTVHTYQAINVARTLLGLTMFCVYPLASYVARHVLIVLFFSGKTARSGDDHSVLARWDRRFILTFFLYAIALVLALLCDDLGTVLALTGAIAGSSLSYLGPGFAFLGVHGLSFLDQIGEVFTVNSNFRCLLLSHPHNLLSVNKNKSGSDSSCESGITKSIMLSLAWYVMFMPLWCTIAYHGGTNFDKFRKLQEIKKGYRQNKLGHVIYKSTKDEMQDGILSLSHRSAVEEDQLIKNGSSNYGSIKKKKMSIHKYKGEKDMQDFEPATLQDFFLAVTYVVVGIVALTAGIFSITAQSD